MHGPLRATRGQVCAWESGLLNNKKQEAQVPPPAQGPHMLPAQQRLDHRGPRVIVGGHQPAAHAHLIAHAFSGGSAAVPPSLVSCSPAMREVTGHPIKLSGSSCVSHDPGQ